MHLLRNNPPKKSYNLRNEVFFHYKIRTPKSHQNFLQHSPTDHWYKPKQRWCSLPAPFIISSISWTGIVSTATVIWFYGICIGMPAQEVWQDILQETWSTSETTWLEEWIKQNVHSIKTQLCTFDHEFTRPLI